MIQNSLLKKILFTNDPDRYETEYDIRIAAKQGCSLDRNGCLIPPRFKEYRILLIRSEIPQEYILK